MGRFEMTRDEEYLLERQQREADLRAAHQAYDEISRLKAQKESLRGKLLALRGESRGVFPDTTLAELVLSVRAYNCLELGGYKTVADIRAASDADLMRLPNFGKSCLRETREATKVTDVLRDYGSPEALVSAWPR
jgi:DNA-directed RNA polymerase alpha subunit